MFSESLQNAIGRMCEVTMSVAKVLRLGDLHLRVVCDSTGTSLNAHTSHIAVSQNHLW